MRVVREIPHSVCKITIFAWNNRYLIKLEQGLLEQTHKIDMWDVENEEALVKMIDAEFLQQAQLRFQEMGQSLYEARQRHSQ